MKTKRALAAIALALVAFTAHAGTTSYYIYDESGHVIGEYDANGNPVQEHVYLGDRPVAVVTGGSSSGGTVDYVSTDQLNTPRVITDSSQAVLWSWNSDPFGNGNPTGSLTYDLRFPGQQYDSETGHNYNYFRDYDASTGRYIESDPVGLYGGLNTYGYVEEKPFALVDPTGRFDSSSPLADALKAAAEAATEEEGADGGPGDLPGDIAAAAVAAAVGVGTYEISKQCDDDQKCNQAKIDAERAYKNLTTKRIPQYNFNLTQGTADATHYDSIVERLRQLKEAVDRVRKYCKQLPADFYKWERLADSNFSPRH